MSGKLLQTTRKLFGLSQDEMAIALDLNSDRAVRAIEIGERDVTGRSGT